MTSTLPESLSITQLGERTGVNPVTLRAWERRYGLLRPTRTSAGHRLYDDAALVRVRTILRWLDKGVPVSRVKALIDGEPEVPAPRAPLDLDLAGRALLEGNLQQFERLCDEWLSGYTLAQVIEQKFRPLLKSLQGSAAPGARPGEALLRTFLMQKFAVRLLSAAPTRRHPGVAMTSLGERYALDALFVALLLREKGVRVQLFGEALLPTDYAWVTGSECIRALLVMPATTLSATAIRRQLGALAQVRKSVMVLGLSLPPGLSRAPWPTATGGPSLLAADVLTWLETLP